MTDTTVPVRVEPTRDLVAPTAPPPAREPTTTINATPPSAPVVDQQPSASAASAAGNAAGSDAVLHQLSRIEDKTARIEEKYARSEALLLRMGDRVDAAAGVITSEAARQSDLIALRNEVAVLTQRTRGLPGAGTLFVMAVLTALLTAAAVVAAARYNLAGWLPAP